MTILSTSAAPTSSFRSIPGKLAIAVALTALADWLFYDHGIGISAVVFALILAATSIAANHAQVSKRNWLLATALLLAGLAPAVEAFNPLSVVFCIVAVATTILITTHREIDRWAARLAALRTLLLSGPIRLAADIAGLRKQTALSTSLALWIAPALLTLVFAALFVLANPLIERWYDAIDFNKARSSVSAIHLMFWIMTIAVVWPFVHIRWKARTADVNRTADVTAQIESSFELLGTGSILRSLILFNLLFAVQSTLDLTYLWGGVALPDGLTYASYAHRGAYPLMLTAILAAVFVLIAIRPGTDAERSAAIRYLVYLWVAQNVLLVISSILRLDLYVETYSLTYLRVAAFIWMMLVAVGLVLILLRLVLNRSNGWLINVNVASLMLALYICAIANFPAIVANYNVDHSREITGKGAALDMNYLLCLGPYAIPAIDRYLQRYSTDLVGRRNQLVERHLQETSSWRSWGFRNWRLKRYLDETGVWR